MGVGSKDQGQQSNPRKVSSFKYPSAFNPGVDIILLPSCTIIQEKV